MVNSVSKSKKDITMYRYNEYIARYVISLKRRLSKSSSNFPEFNPTNSSKKINRRFRTVRTRLLVSKAS